MYYSKTKASKKKKKAMPSLFLLLFFFVFVFFSFSFFLFLNLSYSCTTLIFPFQETSVTSVNVMSHNMDCPVLYLCSVFAFSRGMTGNISV